jgi:hypothetical protein
VQLFLLFYSPALAINQIKSVKHISDYSPKSSNGRSIHILSVSNEGQLLVGHWFDHTLHVYRADGSRVKSITLSYSEIVTDAVWTRQGNIVYCKLLEDSCNVKTISQSSKVIQQTNILQPSSLSVSTGNAIYLISAGTSVYQSTDDGLTWSRMFDVSDGWKCWQVIKASTDTDTDVLWTVVKSFGDWRLQVYTVDKRPAAGGNVTWRDVTLPSHVTVSLSESKLAYDGHTSVFVTDFYNGAVHAWSVGGQYDRLVVLFWQLSSPIRCVAVDTQRHVHVMYVGCDNGAISVFELVYKPL